MSCWYEIVVRQSAAETAGGQTYREQGSSCSSVRAGKRLRNGEHDTADATDSSGASSGPSVRGVPLPVAHTLELRNFKFDQQRQNFQTSISMGPMRIGFRNVANAELTISIMPTEGAISNQLQLKVKDGFGRVWPVRRMEHAHERVDNLPPLAAATAGPSGIPSSTSNFADSGASSPSQSQWFCHLSDCRWSPYLPGQNRMLEQAFQKFQTSRCAQDAYVRFDATSGFEPSAQHFEYQCDVSTMTQKNRATGKQRLFKRVCFCSKCKTKACETVSKAIYECEERLQNGESATSQHRSCLPCFCDLCNGPEIDWSEQLKMLHGHWTWHKGVDVNSGIVYRRVRSTSRKMPTEWQCSICADGNQDEDLVKFLHNSKLSADEVPHVFHLECLQQYINHLKMSAANFIQTLRCPLCQRHCSAVKLPGHMQDGAAADSCSDSDSSGRDSEEEDSNEEDGSARISSADPLLAACGNALNGSFADSFEINDALDPTQQGPSVHFLTVVRDDVRLDGCPRNQPVLCGSLVVPSGIQARSDPNPGRPYEGTVREIYLPATRQGIVAMLHLKSACTKGLLLTVAESQTTGMEGVVWGKIPQKTALCGGVRFHGWPDDGYLQRLMESCHAAGVNASPLQ